MATVQVLTRTFNNEAGESFTYERLVITASIRGKVKKMEIKLPEAEMLAAATLLESDEDLDVAIGNSEAAKADVLIGRVPDPKVVGIDAEKSSFLDDED